MKYNIYFFQNTSHYYKFQNEAMQYNLVITLYFIII